MEGNEQRNGRPSLTLPLLLRSLSSCLCLMIMIIITYELRWRKLKGRHPTDEMSQPATSTPHQPTLDSSNRTAKNYVQTNFQVWQEHRLDVFVRAEQKKKTRKKQQQTKKRRKKQQKRKYETEVIIATFALSLEEFEIPAIFCGAL